MFPYQIMDKLLKLKLELAYKDMSVEQARLHYSEVTTSEVTTSEVTAVTTKSEGSEEVEKPVTKKVIRRKRIPAK